MNFWNWSNTPSCSDYIHISVLFLPSPHARKANQRCPSPSRSNETVFWLSFQAAPKEGARDVVAGWQQVTIRLWAWTVCRLCVSRRRAFAGSHAHSSQLQGDTYMGCKGVHQDCYYRIVVMFDENTQSMVELPIWLPSNMERDKSPLRWYIFLIYGWIQLFVLKF